MPDLLILINGLPGAGKTTLAQAIAPALGATLISKDVVKEAVADAVHLDRETARTLGAAAMEMSWAIAQSVSGIAIVESWWFAPRDREFVRAGIMRVAADRTLEIWCDATVEVARRRYRDRRRHPIHGDADRLELDWDHWAEHGEPLALCSVVVVDTSETVDVQSVVDELT